MGEVPLYQAEEPGGGASSPLRGTPVLLGPLFLERTMQGSETGLGGPLTARQSWAEAGQCWAVLGSAGSPEARPGSHI